MKTTYQLDPPELKLCIELWMQQAGTPVNDADVFTVGPDGTVTIVITTVVAPLKPKPIEPIIVSSVLFDKAFDWVIKWEGSEYENVPNDPGGPTKYGIDTTDDSADLPEGVSLRELTLEQAKAIYLKKYWNGALCNKMPTPVAEVHFNYAVNVGASRSVEFMQAALSICIDGQYGPLTAMSLSSANPFKIALSMIDKADAYYHSLAKSQPDKFSSFLQGWLNRNLDLRKFVSSLV